MPTFNAARTARVGKSRKFEMTSSLFDKASTQKIKPADGMANMLMSTPILR
jgi:hypothetical protein